MKAMNLSTIRILLLLLCHAILSGQNFKIEPYEFISKAGDTVEAELGSFNVLEDRTKISNDSIKLSFIRFNSTSPNPGKPIVYLSGGPGSSATETAKGNRFALFMKLRQVADVIAFDQRGTGLSEKLPTCPHYAEFKLEHAINKAEYVEKTIKNISKCLEFWKQKNVNLMAFNTSESAKDIDELRKVLNVDKISLWGISYGSHLAFEYIRFFEENINKVVLASLEGPNETIKFPKDTENFVFQLAELAKDNYGATKKYPDLQKKIIAVHKRLKQNPVSSSYKNRRGGRDTVGISNFELQSAIATFYLKNPEDSKKLPKLYSKMYEGDFSGIAADVMVMKRYIFSSVRPMPFAMDMQSGISKERANQIEKEIEASILGSSINFLLYEWMTNLDFPQLPNEFRKLKSNKVKALLLSGSLDGRTYVNSGIEIAKKFKNGQHVVIENAGHDLYMQSALVGDMVLDFFKGNALKVNRITLEPTIFE
jgi:pimeloyl-ACP methyl ester carboxylesterase